MLGATSRVFLGHGSDNARIAVMPLHSNSKPLLLLICEPADDIGALGTMLSQKFTVRTATGSKQALMRAHMLTPALIVLNAKAGAEEGIALCRLLKAEPATASIPVMLLTEAGSPARRIEGLRAGAADCIPHPWLPEEVLLRAEAHVRVIRLRRATTMADAPVRRRVTTANVHVNAALSYIAENIDQLPSVAVIAARTGVSLKRLGGLFREFLDTTVSSHIRDERIRIARELLSSTDLSIREVALEVGFSGAANFATAFRELVGTTPQQYRKQSSAATPCARPRPESVGATPGERRATMKEASRVDRRSGTSDRRERRGAARASQHAL